MPEPTRPPDARLAEWLRTAGHRTTWQDAPTWARDGFRQLAADIAAGDPRCLPPELELGRFTAGDAVRVPTECCGR
jgi:hypothetical protein